MSSTLFAFGVHTVLLCTGLAFTSSRIARGSIFVLLLSVELTVLRNFKSGSIPAFDFSIGCLIFQNILYAFDLLILTPDPIDSLRAQSNKPATPTFTSSTQKFLWAAKATQSYRRIGRVTQVANVPTFLESKVPWTFIRDRLKRFVFYMIPLSGVCNYIIYAAGSNYGEWSWEPRVLFNRWLVTQMGGFAGHLALDATYTVMSVLAVGVGLSLPEDWPQLFGAWAHVNTLRGFWGKTWHQLLRKMVTGFGDALAQRVLHFPLGSSRSSYTKLYTAFALSALLHAAGDFVLTRSTYWFSWRFFLLQPIAITFEDMVVALWKRAGFGTMPGGAYIGRGIGYIWMSLWFTATYPLLMAPLMKMMDASLEK